jgi:glycolate oxidase iron-sulfur subunit
MQTNLSDRARQLRGAEAAEAVLRTCVHCGFCNATCPTYQLLGNELDGPRGRIYLIKQMLENGEAGTGTRLHLDRCLTCRNCETTCPSGVRYSRLLDVGRLTVEEWAGPRPIAQRLQRRLLRATLPSAPLVEALVATGHAVRGLLPKPLADKLPRDRRPPPARPPARHTRTVLMLEGCVQPALSPNTNAAAARVLDALGISVVPAPQAGCCGAVEFHLDAQQAGLDRARRNIDAWWPAIEAGAEAIVLAASGCGAFVKEYGHLLHDDPAYAAKAERVSVLARDLVEVLRAEPLERLRVRGDKKIAFHCPCTLQHAQKLGGAVEGVLTRLGFALTAVADGHLCCGSAGTYSITQPELSRQLRDRKLDALERGGPQIIATANIGCQMHLDGARRTPVTHWIELVADALNHLPHIPE